MTDIIKMALNAMPNVKKPQQYFIAHLLALLVTFQGKATFRNLSRYSKYCEKTFSRWYRRNFNFSLFNIFMLKQQLPDGQVFIAALDASFISKSGKKTVGLAQFWRGCTGRTEKGLEISLLSVIDVNSETAYGLNAKQTIDQKEETRVDLYTKHVLEQSNHLTALNIQYLCVDSYYSKVKFVEPVRKTGLHLIGKLRHDANLRWPNEQAYTGKGRPKIYDGKVNVEQDLSRFQSIGMEDEKTRVYTAKLYSPGLQCWIRVVLLRFKRGTQQGHALIYSTDINLTPRLILKYYQLRFQIEFFFRDAKQYTGLTDCQARDEVAINFQVNSACSALNAVKLEDFREKKITGKTVISIDSWKRKKFNQHLMKRLFSKLGLSLTEEKVKDVYCYFSEYGSIVA